MKVSEITPKSKDVSMVFKVISASDVRDVTLKTDNSQHRVCDFTVGDETGVVKLVAWDSQIEQLQVGKVYEIKNGYVKLFKGHIQVNVGRNGTLSESSEEVSEVNESNDVSAAEHEDDYRPRYGGGRSGGYGGGSYGGGSGGYGGGGYGGGRRGGYNSY